MRFDILPLGLLLLTLQACHPSALRQAFQRNTGKIVLPAGVTELHVPLQLVSGTHNFEITGDPAGSVLHLASDFKGKAAIAGDGVSTIRLSGFRISGTRTTLISDRYLPPSDVTFADYYSANGILLTNSSAVTIQNVSFDRISAFPILISHCTNVRITNIHVQDSGTLNAQGHSNTTGGILLEQGTRKFFVQDCIIERICGNGIWTHSNYGSPLNEDGVIEENTIRGTPRDAIQVGHAVRVLVAKNSGRDIGFPVEQADLPGGATPVAIDTAGNVRESIYFDNHFEDVDGQCIDLDGFHGGQVLSNSCVNRKPRESYPLSHVGIVFGNSNLQMRPEKTLVKDNLIQGFGYGGVYLIGQQQQIINNRFIDVNRNHCTGDMRVVRCNYAPAEPGMLRSGIYLANHAARPAETSANIIRDNSISGFGMDRWCIQEAPGVSAESNAILNNTCVAAK